MFRPRRFAAGLAFVSACASDGDPGPASVVRDSAGITIVESARPEHTGERAAWRLGTEPRVIGVEHGAAELQFDGIMGIALLSDGRIAVGDMASGEVRFFGEDGAHNLTVGRAGDGPGEFGQIMEFHQLPADTIVVLDGLAQFEVIAASGQWVRGVHAPMVPVRYSPERLLPDGTLVLRDNPQPAREGGEQELAATLFALAPGDTVPRPLLRTPPLRFVPGFRGFPAPIVFGPLPVVEVGSDRIIAAHTGAWAFDVHDLDGTLRRRFRRASTPEPVTDEHRAAYRAVFIDMPGEGGPPPPRLVEQRRGMADAATFAEHLPAFDRTLFDRAGNVWVQRFDVRTETTHGVPGRFGFNPVWPWPRTWSIFDREGRWLTDIQTPPMFHLLDVAADRVAGILRDDLGVDRVAIYRLQKPQG